MLPTPWHQQPRAAELLASCGATEPPFRQDRDGTYRYHNSDPRVSELRKLEKAAWEATYAECHTSGDYTACKAHLTTYEAIQTALEAARPVGRLAREALAIIRAEAA